MFNFLHTYQPSPILFQVEEIKFRWYGFLICLAIIIGLIIVSRLAKKYKLISADIYDLSFYCLIFGLLGARIYYVLYFWSDYQNNLSDIVKIWQGGLAIHGAIIGGALAAFFFCAKNKLSFGLITDIFSPVLLLGQAIGRWGNYFNQEVFGKPTNLPWGIPIDSAFRPEQFSGYQYFHPTFLYESILNLIGFSLLIYLHSRRLKNPTKVYYKGNIFIIYLLIYSINRFLMEFLRVDNANVFFGIRWPQLLSGAIIVFCLVYLFVRRKIANKNIA